MSSDLVFFSSGNYINIWPGGLRTTNIRKCYLTWWLGAALEWRRGSRWHWLVTKEKANTCGRKLFLMLQITSLWRIPSFQNDVRQDSLEWSSCPRSRRQAQRTSSVLRQMAFILCWPQVGFCDFLEYPLNTIFIVWQKGSHQPAWLFSIRLSDYQIQIPATLS